MKKIKKIFAYLFAIVSAPGKLAEAVNKAESIDQLDKIVCGGFKDE